jgi:hypothetical protein
VWCGVVWCVVWWCVVWWCGVVWCGVVRCGVAWGRLQSPCASGTSRQAPQQQYHRSGTYHYSTGTAVPHLGRASNTGCEWYQPTGTMPLSAMAPATSTWHSGSSSTEVPAQGGQRVGARVWVSVGGWV